MSSIQEVRDLLRKATEAQKVLAKMSQEKIDSLCKAIAKAGYDNRELLARMAVDETGFGIVEDKIIKNEFASKYVLDAIKDMRTVGIIEENTEKKYMEVAVPVGVVAGLIPSTNPTSTVIYKTLISIKAGNSIVFSPHPSAKDSILKTVELLQQAVEEAGCPKEVIGVITNPTMAATDELMKNSLTKLILATGGSAMVKAAYSSGTPAIGVGPGNGPAYIERTADIKQAIKDIIDSKTFDNGTVCASEQSIIAEAVNKEEIIEELKHQGAYFLNEDESKKLSKFVLRANGTMNPQIVGKSVETIAELANLSIPKGTKVLVAPENRVGKEIPFSREKLGPILAFYSVNDWKEACHLAFEILTNEGAGHTMTIHSQDEEVIRQFALEKPVSRLLVNTPATLGGIGASTNLFPALTLGCGAVGGSSTSDNISPMNLFNVRRIAWGVKSMEEIRPAKDERKLSDNEELSQEQLIDLLVNKILEKL